MTTSAVMVFSSLLNIETVVLYLFYAELGILFSLVFQPLEMIGMNLNEIDVRGSSVLHPFTTALL